MTKKDLTPLQAIRKRCLECMNGQAKEVRLCKNSEDGCVLSPYRFGTKTRKGSVVKKIREFCLGCSESAYTVKHCVFNEGDCPLFPYRMGHNPARKGIGRKSFANDSTSEIAS